MFMSQINVAELQKSTIQEDSMPRTLPLSKQMKLIHYKIT
jgi:hypothetical protein